MRMSRSFTGKMASLRPTHKGPSLWMITNLSLLVVVYLLADIEPVRSQQHSLLNTPPILYVPERNWRIFETEGVGQIIARIRAEDAENDELVFGLEPHFHANYANPSETSGGGESSQDNLPFRIDPVNGIVYLNESLVGRAGENFFLYITVSDGQLTAKNEVYVNILAKSNGKGGGRPPPSVTSVVQNISQFLPSFDSLPGVQSIRNQLPNRRPSNSFPLNFGLNPAIYKPSQVNSNDAMPSNGYTHQGDFHDWFKGNSHNNNNNNNEPESEEEDTTISTAATTTSPTNRIRLTPIRKGNPTHYGAGTKASSTQDPVDRHDASATDEAYKMKTSADRPNQASNAADATESGNSAPNAATLRATVILVITAVCGLFVAAAAIVLFLYRKRLCAISKTLKKKSKEEMAKKSNQSNLSSNLTDDSRNSMGMQHWNGPLAYGNRYVPWERDQQLMQHPMEATSQFSTSAPNGGECPAGPGGGVTNTNGHANGANTSTSGSQSTKYDRWEFPRHRLKFFNILGEGAFGQVWRCEAVDIDGVDGITTVAVKTLKENAAEVEKKDLLSELEVMKSLQPHVNVVRFLGCCTDKDPVFVILEYVNRGKLQTYLRNSRTERHYGNTHGKSNVLTSGDLTSFMYQVAKGMDYLTSKGIIHRDLAARNILITEDHTCKVADFGFARDVITSKIYERKSEGKLPIRWMAIESLYDNIFSVKSDIWSFGILMWEIVTLGSTPYPGISAADVMKKVRDGYRLEKPEHCRRELYNIMYYCWAQDQNERPNFAEVVQMLDKLLHTEMDYIELERFPDHNYYNILNLSGEKL